MLTVFNFAYSLLIVTDGELKVTRNDTLLLVITSSVTGELKNLSGEVLEDSREVDCMTCQNHLRLRICYWPRTGGTSTNTLSVVTPLQETVDTTDGELETSLRRTGLRFAGLTTSLARGRFATATHKRTTGQPYRSNVSISVVLTLFPCQTAKIVISMFKSFSVGHMHTMFEFKVVVEGVGAKSAGGWW